MPGLMTGGGTYSGTAPSCTLTSTGSTHLTIEAKLYRLTPTGAPLWQCPKNDLACTLRARVVLTAGSSATSGSMPNPVTGDTASLVGTSNAPGGVPVTVVGGACPSTITSQMVGKHVSIPGATPLVLTV